MAGCAILGPIGLSEATPGQTRQPTLGCQAHTGSPPTGSGKRQQQLETPSGSQSLGLIPKALAPNNFSASRLQSVSSPAGLRLGCLILQWQEASLVPAKEVDKLFVRHLQDHPSSDGVLELNNPGVGRMAS